MSRARTGSLTIGKNRSYHKLIHVGLVVALYVYNSTAAPPSYGYEVCQTDTCRNIAEEILGSMDPKVDPCDDFYKFTCGNWANNHQPSLLGPRWNHIGIIANRTNYRLKEIAESGWNESETFSVIKAKQLYRACMDFGTIENMGISSVLRFIERAGGWPMIMNHVEFAQTPKIPWQSIERTYNFLTGSSPIFNLAVSVNLRSNDKNIITISPGIARQAKIPIGKRMDIFQNPGLMHYKNFIKDIANSMADSIGSIVNEKQLESDATGIVIFETLLSNIAAAAVDIPQSATLHFDKIQKVMTIAEFQAFYDSAGVKTRKGQIHWLQLIQTFFAASTVKIDSSEQIVVMGERYFKLLVGLLDNTSERDIVNTLHWFFVKSTIPRTNQEMTKRLEIFMMGPNADPTKLPPSPPRWMRCLAGNELKHALAYSYVQKYFSDEAKATALKMVHEIKAVMANHISKAVWLKPTEKKASNEKIANMIKFIGYPDWYTDLTLDQRYQKLNIGAFYLENMLLVQQFIHRQQLESLRKPVNKETWIATPVDINAFYSPLANSITFPAAFLQMPFFDARHPDALNYGGIGSVIGHEISHGFDNIGSQFDKNGNGVRWWSNSTRQEFTNRAQCFVDQFNNYKVQVHNITVKNLGYHTLGENIADSTGMRAVFEAYQKHIKKPGHKDVRLPGLEKFNAEKLFFLGFAGSLCQQWVHPEHIQYFLRTDVHSDNSLRVLGTLSNTEDFAKTFKCPASSVMNPPKKCGIWY